MRTSVLVLVVFSLLSQGCSRVSEETASPITVTVDPRMELLAAVQYLAGYRERFRLLTSLDFPYRKELEETFSPFKSHPAVSLFGEMAEAGFTYDAPPTLMLHLSAPPELTVKVPLTEYILRRAGGKAKAEKFIALLRDFARISEFSSFFSSHQAFYKSLTDEVEKTFEEINLVGALEDYYGWKQRSYTIILVPMFSGNYGPRVAHADGTVDIYNIISPVGMIKGHPWFGGASSFRHLAWHEFGHSFVNPFGEKYREELEKYVSLFEPIKATMRAHAYGDWVTTVNEHIVRAITTRLTFIHFGPEQGERAVEKERQGGFFYVGPLCEKLEVYEKNRSTYPTFSDFYPHLIKVFEELSEKDLGEEFFFVPFTGTINAVVMDKTKLVLVVPTNESDKQAQEKIHAYVVSIKKKFFPKNPVLTDKEALTEDLSGCAVVIYGTVRGNLLLAKHFKDMPFKVEADRIVGAQPYEGSDLRLIFAWPNPFNGQKGFLVYTAQRARDIPGINNVFHGPTDYVIARGIQVLKAGNFRKDTGRWTF